MRTKDLKVEINILSEDKTGLIETSGGGLIMFTPPISKDYWSFRVRISDQQAIVAFPKFGTFGIGFQIEDYDWNTNLPYTVPANEIYNHIKGNKGDRTVSKSLCVTAIEMLQEVIAKYKDKI